MTTSMRFDGAKSGAVALALLLASAPMAQAGGEHHAGVRRGAPPPPPPWMGQPGQPPQGFPQGFSAPPTPPTGFRTAFPPGTSNGPSAPPLSSMPSPGQASVPLNGGGGQRWAGPSYPVGRGAPFGAPPTALDPRFGSPPQNTPGFGNPLPFGASPMPRSFPRPLGETAPSPRWDTFRGGRGSGGGPTEPFGNDPRFRTNPGARPWGATPDVSGYPGGRFAGPTAFPGTFPTAPAVQRSEHHGWRSWHRPWHGDRSRGGGFGPSPLQPGAVGFGWSPSSEPCPCVEAAPPTYVPYPVPVPQPYAVPVAPYAPEPTFVPAAPAAIEPEAPLAPAETEAAAPSTRDEAFAGGFEAFQAEAYAEALEAFEALTAADPKDGEAWMAVAHAAFALGRYDTSARAVARAAALGAFPRGYRFDAAALYAREGAFDALLARLSQRVATTPRDVDARLVLAWLDVSLGRRREAQEQVQQVLELRPNDPTAPVLALAVLPAAPGAQAEAAPGEAAIPTAPPAPPGRPRR